MPVTLSYPGVYIEEVSSGVHTITGVATSITAFIGRTLRGPVDSDKGSPVRVQSFAEYTRTFGGLWRDSTMSYAVQQFFQNGGTDALIVRVHNNGKAATLTLAAGFNLVAASPGKWGDKLRVRVDYPSSTDDPSGKLFNLSVRDTVPGGVTERFLNLSTDPNNARFVTHVLEQESSLVRVSGAVPATRPAPTPDATGDPFPPGSSPFNADGDDGAVITAAQISSASLEAFKQGIWALEKADLFNLLCIPPFKFDTDIDSTTRSAAASYCEKRRAMYVVDPLMAWKQASDVTGAGGLNSTGWGLVRAKNAALYFPYLRQPDALQENRLADFAPCGAVAGTIARTDGQRGVWKAPAGIEATLNGVVDLTVNLTDGENGQLNPLAVNCLRTFPVIGRTVWGARTLNGADQLASEWKYLPVRRTALFLEESMFRGTQWVVFEPNDEPLWAQIRLNLGAFMQNLFRQGAFQGRSPREAYFVRCDKETTTQNDIDLGIVNIVVGFAPLKPAEFVVIKLQQIAGQIQA
jgi:hypothetical protein